ncbi:MAG TPA: hypothetical protein VF897_22070 [Roseiflexaceae bacterium]
MASTSVRQRPVTTFSDTELALTPAGPPFQGAQRLQRLEHRPAGRGGVEGRGLKQGRQEASEALVAAQKLTAERGVLAVGGVGLGGELLHRCSGPFKL